MSTPSSDQHVERSSAADIERELIHLRQYEGMSILKIREKCPATMALPATTHELERLQMANSDRSVAAHRVINCAIQALIYRTDYAQILSGCLNIRPETSRDDAGKTKAVLLDLRRSRLKAQLHVGSKAYRRLEDEAFVELAATLIMCRQSPCGDTDGGLRPSANAAFNAISAYDPRLDQILNIFGYEQRSPVRAAYAAKFLESVPNGVQAAEEYNSKNRQDDWAKFETLIGAIIINEWIAFLSLADLNQSLFSSESLRILVLGDPTAYAREDFDKRVAAREQELTSVPHTDESGEPLPYYYSQKLRSLSELALRATNIEATDRWREVLLGGSDTRRVLQPSN